MIALVITADGTKVPVGLYLGDTAKKTVVIALLSDLVARWLSAEKQRAACSLPPCRPMSHHMRTIRRPRDRAAATAERQHRTELEVVYDHR